MEIETFSSWRIVSSTLIFQKNRRYEVAKPRVREFKICEAIECGNRRNAFKNTWTAQTRNYFMWIVEEIQVSTDDALTIFLITLDFKDGSYEVGYDTRGDF